jgi:anti-anti-sigma regulatory factor
LTERPSAGGPEGTDASGSVEVESLGGRAWRVPLEGQLDASAVTRFNQRMARLVDADHRPVLVDLRPATFIDSTLLGAVVGWARHARETGGGPVGVVVGDGSSPAAQLLAQVTSAQDIDTFATPDEGADRLCGDGRADRHRGA